MSFTFDWAVLGSANGSAILNDAGQTSELVVTSQPGIFYSSFSDGTLIGSFLREPTMSAISFSNPIKNLTFEILDLDSNENSYDDKVTVEAFNRNGVAVAVEFSQLESYHVQTGNTVEANGNSSTAVNGPGAPDSITMNFGGPVTAIRITMENGSAVGNSGAIGISDLSGDIVCFAAGTRILAKPGEVTVDALRVGDLVRTRDHGMQAIRWIGSREVPAIGKFTPIQLAAGVLGNTRDLVLSPQHRVLLAGWQAELFFGESEVLVAAKHLLQMPGVTRLTGGYVRYFHILFDNHEIILAESAWCESFHPGCCGIASLDEGPREELLSLFPEIADYGPAAHASLRRHEAEVVVAAL